jgi:electron transport complex protein RnfG
MDTPNAPEAAPAEPRAAGSWLKGLVALGIALTLLTALLAYMASATRERIVQNEQAGVIAGLRALLDAETYDNEPLLDTIEITAPAIVGSERPVTIYRARKAGRPVAAVMRTIAPDGYRGPIELLVAIAYDGTLIGVQVLHHNETPGLGNQFETRAAAWLDDFAGRSLADPPQQRWTVRKDGGDFDAFTGATITPRAIIRAVRRSLELYAAQRAQIFD